MGKDSWREITEMVANTEAVSFGSSKFFSFPLMKLHLIFKELALEAKAIEVQVYVKVLA